MAKKRNRYKGGSAATLPQDLFYGSELRYEWITPQLVRATAISDKTLRAEYSRLRAIANKRLKRMQGRPEASSTLERLPDAFPTVRGMDRGQVVQQLNEVTTFLSARRGSLSGIKKSNKQIKKSLAKKGINIPQDQIAKFGSFMNAMKKALGMTRDEYGSEQLADLWDELFQKGKISQNKFEKRVKQVMSDIEQNQKEAFSRSQRAGVNKLLRDHPISTYFDDLALDPKTIKAAEKKNDRAVQNPQNRNARQALTASRRARLARVRNRRK